MLSRGAEERLKTHLVGLQHAAGRLAVEQHNQHLQNERVEQIKKDKNAKYHQVMAEEETLAQYNGNVDHWTERVKACHAAILDIVNRG